MSREIVVTDDVHAALARIAAQGITVVGWPPPADPSPVRDRCVAQQPTLHLLAPGTAPPPPAPLVEWVRLPGDAIEIEGRAHQLLSRARRLGPVVVAVQDQVLRVDDQRVVLSPLEERVARVLVEHLGSLVRREDLVLAGWPDPAARPARLGQVVAALRRRLGSVPLELHTVRSLGFVLERNAPGRRPIPEIATERAGLTTGCGQAGA